MDIFSISSRAGEWLDRRSTLFFFTPFHLLLKIGRYFIFFCQVIFHCLLSVLLSFHLAEVQERRGIDIKRFQLLCRFLLLWFVTLTLSHRWSCSRLGLQGCRGRMYDTQLCWFLSRAQRRSWHFCAFEVLPLLTYQTVWLHRGWVNIPPSVFKVPLSLPSLLYWLPF